MCGAVTLHSARETLELGNRLGADLCAGDVVVLTGPLGAGKTVLAKGIAQAMDVDGPVTSPTFVLARVHRPLRAGAPAMVHVDLLPPVGTTRARICWASWTHWTSTPTWPTRWWWSSGARGWSNDSPIGT